MAVQIAKKVTVLGGDKRYIKLCELFCKSGYDAVYTQSDKISTISRSDIIILPIPSFDREGNINGSEYNVYDLFSGIGSDTIIFGGKIPQVIKKISEEYKVKLYDYSESEEFSLLNAIPSAEGAILTALSKTRSTISGSSFTVLGYGRIGRALSTRLHLLGGRVTVGARSGIARANATCDGIFATTIDNALKIADNSLVVFNTVPAPIITERNAVNIQNTLVIDLASIPGGVTEQSKLILGENFIHALSLPGKYFPDTAGEIIFKSIKSILAEKGNDL